MKTRVFILGVCIAALVAGCTSITTPSGATYRNFGFEKKFSELTITATNGTSLKVKGYTSEASAIAGAVAEGVAKGAKP
jgi:outer membrane lipoprotein SlyB